ncbi:MAG: transglycosylase SLT domain-containing protein [Candidatus Rokubacteria bacterium]|nr:transglycosylase SLT domain-containing protein [Candidatus Rokubacteria bacterium]
MLSRYREPVRVWTDPIGRLLWRAHLRPNHLTLLGFGVSLLAAAAFVLGELRSAGGLLLLAGLCDFFDGSLARASGQVTPFGAFLDSVIDRYSDLVVMLGIVVLFARMPHVRGALVAMAGLVGSIMVSYTKARAESIGVECNVGFMERPERMICLIAGSLLGLLEPALWILAVLGNVTALHRIVFTRRCMRDADVAKPVGMLALLLVILPATASAAGVPAESERSWARAVEAYQQGDPAPIVREFSAEAALRSPIADYVRWTLSDALARRGNLVAARNVAASIAERHRDSRLAPAGLLLAATLAAQAGDDAGSQAFLAKLIGSYPDSRELPKALYLLGMTGEARGQLEAAAHAYREVMVLAPASGWADGATDRLAQLAQSGVRIPDIPLDKRIDRAERLLKGGVAKTAAEEAERIATEAQDPSIALRALKVVASAAQRLGRYATAARALELAVARAPRAERPRLMLEQGRFLARGKHRARALPIFAAVVTAGSEAEAAEAAWERARVLDDLGREADATAAYRAVAARYPAREVAGAALWRLGWVAYLRGQMRTAEQSWTRLAGIPGGRAYRAGALYWAGRAREATRSRGAAARLYARVLAESPRGYYGLLAARRASAPPDGGRKPAVTLPADPVEAIADDPGYARVDLLRRIGFVEYAWQELEDVVQRSIGDPVRLYGLTSAYVKEERYHLALRILRRHFVSFAVTGDPSLPQAFWEMLYPFGWRPAVTEAAEQEGLDPFLVAAIVREESSYHPRALSRAGARGLMQLMPATAETVARAGGITLGGSEPLEDPGLNIQLGTRFLAGMLRDFGDPRLAVAAYNAGPGRVRQWLRTKKTDDLEAFVEQIPFDETRQYVKRVMLSWQEYRRIYGVGGPDMAPHTPQRSEPSRGTRDGPR